MSSVASAETTDASNDSNLCCIKWRVKCEKSTKARNELRKVVNMLKGIVEQIEAEKQYFQSACADQQKRAELLEEEKGREVCLRTCLEEEIAALKAMNCSIKPEVAVQNDKFDKELASLKACISGKDTELGRLNQLLVEEKTRAEGYKRAAELDNRKVLELQNELQSEKRRADEANEIADASKKKQEENRVLVEKLNKDRENFRLKWDEAKRMFEAEKLRAIEVKSSADEEKALAIEQRRIAEANEKRLTDEICRANNLSVELEAERRKVDTLQKELQEAVSAQRRVFSSPSDELRKNLEDAREKVSIEKQRTDLAIFEMEEQKKVAEINIRKSLEEKGRADKLLEDLESSKQTIENLQQELGKVNCIIETERMALSKERELVVALNLKLEQQERSALESLKPQLDELRRNLELEKKRVSSEKKRADLELSLKEEQKKAVEDNIKKAMEEKGRADKLCRDFQCSRQRIENLEAELKKVNIMLEAERIALVEEKKSGDVLKQKLEEIGRIAIENEKRAMEEKGWGDSVVKELETVIQKLKEKEQELSKVQQSRDLVGGALIPCSDFALKEKIAKVSLLQEHLKLEKKRVKHFKEVAKLEKERVTALQQELHALDQDFQCLLQQLDLLSDTFNGRSRLNKRQRLLHGPSLQLSGRMPSGSPSQLDMCRDAEPRMPSLSSRDESCHRKPSADPAHVECHKESPSGMKTDLEPLLGGSHGEILPSSPLNSNTESFSDEQLLGSQERANCSLTTIGALAIKNAKERATIPLLDNGKQLAIKNTEEHATVPVRYDGEKVGTCAVNRIDPVQHDVGNVIKRRKIIDEVVKFMPSEGDRLFQVAETNLLAFQNTSHLPMIKQTGKEDLPLVGRDVDLSGYEDGLSMKRKFCESPETLQLVDDACLLIDGDRRKHLHQTNINVQQNCQSLWPDRGDQAFSTQDDLINFEQEIGGNYMKLLELDDAVAEERFRMAMEMPLSPNLPDLQSEVELPTAGVPISVSRFANDVTGCSANNKNQNFCIVFSDMQDIDSRSRIFCATKNFVGRLSVSLQTRWLGMEIIRAVGTERGLKPRENICVIFSLLLLNFTGVSNSDSMVLHGQELLDAFSAHVKSVLLDEETRDIFKKICDLDDLLGLGEDFVLHKILLQESRTPGSLCDSSIDLQQLEESSVLQPKLSPTNLVVAGSIILASIAVVTGVIGYVCEVSLKILSTSRADYSNALLILHTFAYICGKEYFTTSNYLAAMKAVKIWVTSVEGSLEDNDNMCLQQEDATWPQFSPCDNCPFSETLCLEDVSSELFEELRECMKCATELFYPPEVESLPGSLGIVLSSLKLLAAKMSWDGVCNNVITKVFKMLESFEKETVQVPRQQPRSKYRNTILTALVLFLGDLGRFGVEASGYDDFGVLQMKRRLLAILCQTNPLKCDDIQLAVIYALIGLHPNDHKIQKNNAENSFQIGNSASIPTAPRVMADIISSVGRERTSYLLSLMNP